MNPLSYSQLISNISSGEVKSLLLIPKRRQVIVTLNNGSKQIVSILPDDQQILEVAKTSNVPLDVKDVREEEAMAGMLGNLGLVVIIVLGLSFLLRRSAQAANRALSFTRTDARLKPLASIGIRFEDVEGIDDAKSELEEVITFLRHPETFTKLGAKIPKGVLLVGLPGTGKTLLAKAIAGEAAVPFFSIAGSEFVELFVGVGASRVRDMFKKAKEKSPCLIFIDEIDSVGRQRGAGIGGGNDEREQTLNQLLTEMDGFADDSGVIVLAATNRADVLDTALMRPGRFDRTIFVNLPDKKGREGILSVHARTRPLAAEVKLSEWALRTPGFTGAQLSNLLNEAAILTARENKAQITNKQMEFALERITMGLASPALQDDSKKRLIAYHEIGHALVAAHMPHADKVDKVSILPRTGGIGGFTRFWPDEEAIDSGLFSKNYLFARLVVALGGRAAELIVFGPNEITQGASSDLQNVSSIAREMVTKFGFSPLGPIALETGNKQVFLGKNLIQTKPTYAESTGKVIDEQVRTLANTAMLKAVGILESQREVMDKLVDVLIVEETLNAEQFRRLAELEQMPQN